MAKLYYCGGFGGQHIIPGNAGRHWFACSRCRWAPNHRDSDEHKAKVLDVIAGRNAKAAVPAAPSPRPHVQEPLL